MDKRIDKVLELLVVWVLLTSALGLTAALMGYFLAPQVLLLSLLLTGCYGWWTHVGKPPSWRPIDWRHLIVLLLVGLFFRLPTYNCILGGQDEGVYVNMAHYIARTGEIAVHDDSLQKLQGTRYVATYLADNRLDANQYMPGVYVDGKDGVHLQFQFYHLFPVWMALAVGIFGGASGVWALTLFALISILFFYRLALEISKSPRVAMVAGILLAVCPLHAFFSKFPVTEIPALAFSLIGFTYLAMYHNAATVERRRRWLWISCAAFAMLFVTRISGFMYMPFVIAIAFASMVADEDRKRSRAVMIWAVATVILYAVSVWYGLEWSGHYSKDIYRTSFDPIMGHYWRLILLLLLLSVFSAWVILVRLARDDSWRARLRLWILEPSRLLIGPIAMLGLAVGILKIYWLGWTDHYANNETAARWGFSHAEFMAVNAASLTGLVIYLGPLIPLLFMMFALRKKGGPDLEMLRVFAAGFFVYVAVLQWIIPYQPYYARYLLSEALPYMLLLVVLVWPVMRVSWMRRGVGLMLVLSGLYMVHASEAQLGKGESQGLYSSLRNFLGPVDSGDLVLISSDSSESPTANELKTAVLYTFGRHAVTVSDSALTDVSYLTALDARYDDIYLASPSSATPEGFSLVNDARIKVWAFQWTHMYPENLVLRGDQRLYLYRRSKGLFPLNVSVYMNSHGDWNAWLLQGWSNSEDWGIWSLGKSSVLSMDPRELPFSKNGLRLTFEFNGLINAKLHRQRILVTLDKVPVGSHEIDYPSTQGAVSVDVPPELLQSSEKLRIGFDLPDAVSPFSIGVNGDNRVLAIGLKSIRAEIPKQRVPALPVKDQANLMRDSPAIIESGK